MGAGINTNALHMQLCTVADAAAASLDACAHGALVQLLRYQHTPSTLCTIRTPTSSDCVLECGTPTSHAFNNPPAPCKRPSPSRNIQRTLRFIVPWTRAQGRLLNACDAAQIYTQSPLRGAVAANVAALPDLAWKRTAVHHGEHASVYCARKWSLQMSVAAKARGGVAPPRCCAAFQSLKRGQAEAQAAIITSKRFTPPQTRTENLRFRRAAPYPLGQQGGC